MSSPTKHRKRKHGHPGDRHSVRAQRIAKATAEAGEREKAEIEAMLHEDMTRIVNAADWETFARSENRADMIYTAGRILFVASRAAERCGISTDHPDMRIMLGAASALGDIAARPKETEQHRPAVQSGLKAVERIWPSLDIFALGIACMEFDQVTKSIKGLSLSDFPQSVKESE
jgi:hypothetical protein